MSNVDALLGAEATMPMLEEELSAIRVASTGIQAMQEELSELDEDVLKRIVPIVAQYVCPSTQSQANATDAVWALLGYPPHPDARR